MTSPLEMTIHTDADLFELWQQLMGPWGFSTRTLWLVFLDEDGRTHPVIVPIEDLPSDPDERSISSLRYVVGDLVSDLASEQRVCSVPMLISRPGSARMQSGDRRWARALLDGLGPELARWPMHLATKGSVRVFAPDDLIAA